MNYFDLHCDTLCECLIKNRTFKNNDLHIDLKHRNSFDTYIQCFASWIQPDIKDKAKNFFDMQDILKTQAKEHNLDIIKNKDDLLNVSNVGIIPTIEDADFLARDFSLIDKAKENHIKMIGLTWNNDNAIGSSIATENDLGISETGRDFVKLIDENKFVIDLSHSSEKLFDDVLKITNSPFVCSHSNAKGVCSHKRNLNDEQIKEIIKRKGLIGINFYKDFLDDNGENANIDSIIKHIDYFLSLGGEDVISMGSDFDGAEVPADINGISYVPNIHKRMIELNYDKKLINKIFFLNAFEFFVNKY